jgi:hypothetical protein
MPAKMLARGRCGGRVERRGRQWWHIGDPQTWPARFRGARAAPRQPGNLSTCLSLERATRAELGHRASRPRGWLRTRAVNLSDMTASARPTMRADPHLKMPSTRTGWDPGQALSSQVKGTFHLHRELLLTQDESPGLVKARVHCRAGCAGGGRLGQPQLWLRSSRSVCSYTRSWASWSRDFLDDFLSLAEL